MKRIVGTVIAVILTLSLQTAATAEVPELQMQREADVHSYARLDELSTSHLDLNIAVDFAAKQVKGTATYTLEWRSETETLYLDTRELTIEKAEVQVEDVWQDTAHKLGLPHKVLGRELRVSVPEGATKVRVHYHSAPTASGLQWLTPEQTAGKDQPFMFSQSQAIHARSWIPIQDTPAVRLTYSARVTTPKEVIAVMSASNDLTAQRDGEFEFQMPQPIPPYLIAIAAGDLVVEEISDKVAVFAESYIAEEAAWEFGDTPNMIETTEAMYGPYRWDRYDLLVLPPSFPFGGMENPRLSFITPTVISGDRTLINLIAHELAHSWSGNLVTNASWRDLWINEGFTSYVENRIMEALFGESRAQMELALGYQDLMGDLNTLDAADTVLNIELGMRDPDDVFSQVPYVKGQLFLVYLEKRFGREVFDAFLRKYFNDFAFESIDTEMLKSYMKRELIEKHPGIVSMDKINAWIHAPGLPEDAPQPTSDAFANVDAQQKVWLKGGQLRTDAWTTHEWLHFLNNLPLDISSANMARLDREFDLTNSKNSEIAHAWLKLAIQKNYEPAQARLRSYLLSIGRNKLVGPLYRELARTEQGLQWAREVFAQARSGYHPLTQSQTEQILGLDD